jgi:hypothetical protein
MEAARCFRSNWGQVYRSVQYVVDYGLAHRRLDQVTALGVDEVQFGQGNHFVTLVYQIDTCCRRLLWMGGKRTMKTLDAGFTALERSGAPDQLKLAQGRTHGMHLQPPRRICARLFWPSARLATAPQFPPRLAAEGSASAR